MFGVEFGFSDATTMRPSYNELVLTHSVGEMALPFSYSFLDLLIPGQHSSPDGLMLIAHAQSSQRECKKICRRTGPFWTEPRYRFEGQSLRSRVNSRGSSSSSESGLSLQVSTASLMTSKVRTAS